MKTTAGLLKILSQVCWLCVHVAIAVWAIRLIVRQVRDLRLELHNKDIVVGHIVR